MSTEGYIWEQSCAMRQQVNGQKYTCGWRGEAETEAEIISLFNGHKAAAHADGTWEDPPRGGWKDIEARDDYE